MTRTWKHINFLISYWKNCSLFFVCFISITCLEICYSSLFFTYLPLEDLPFSTIIVWHERIKNRTSLSKYQTIISFTTSSWDKKFISWSHCQASHTFAFQTTCMNKRTNLYFFASFLFCGNKELLWGWVTNCVPLTLLDTLK